MASSLLSQSDLSTDTTSFEDYGDGSNYSEITPEDQYQWFPAASTTSGYTDTGNGSTEVEENGISSELAILEVITASAIMSACIAATIVGNVLVILSVFTYRPLRGVQNFYIVSLAVADLGVAILVMPFNVAYFVMRQRWIFGAVCCYVWLTADILTCTASILNLCAIALDRYRAIHDPISYAQSSTVGRVLKVVVAVWAVSLVLSLPPLIGWNRGADSLYNPVTSTCQLTDDPGFVVYSAAGSFFIPLALMSFVYVQIFRATRRRLRLRTRAYVSSAAQSVVTSLPVAPGGEKTSNNGGAGGEVEGRSTAAVEAVRVPSVNNCSASSIEDDVIDVDDPDVVTGLVSCYMQPVLNCSADTLSIPTGSALKSACSGSDYDVSDIVLADWCSEASVIPSPSDRNPVVGDNPIGRKSADDRLSIEVVDDSSCDERGGRQSSSLGSASHPSESADRSNDQQLYRQHHRQSSWRHRQRSATNRTSSEASCRRDRTDDPNALASNGVSRSPHSAVATRPALARSRVGDQQRPDALSTLTRCVESSYSTTAGLFSRALAEKQRQSAAKERRVARTMAVIMAAFVVCWVPFFTMYIVSPFCRWCADHISQRAAMFTVWLGYINSTLNPVIYTVFNIDFRRAFKALLTPRQRARR